MANQWQPFQLIYGTHDPNQYQPWLDQTPPGVINLPDTNYSWLDNHNSAPYTKPLAFVAYETYQAQRQYEMAVLWDQYYSAQDRAVKQADYISDQINKGLYRPWLDTRYENTAQMAVDQLLEWQLLQEVAYAYYKFGTPEHERIKIIKKHAFGRDITIKEKVGLIEAALNASADFLINGDFSQTGYGALLPIMGRAIQQTSEDYKPKLKATANTMQYGRITNKSAPGLLILMASEIILPGKEGMMIDNTGLIEFATDQLTRIDTIPAEYTPGK